MPNKLRIHATLLIKGLLKRKDDQHFVNAFLHPTQSCMLPGPQLRTYEPNHRNTRAPKMLGQPEVYVGKINKHRDVGSLVPNTRNELPIAPVNMRNVPKNLGQPHNRNVLSIDNPLLASLCHLASAQSCKACFRQSLAKRGDQRGAVVVS